MEEGDHLYPNGKAYMVAGPLSNELDAPVWAYDIKAVEVQTGGCIMVAAVDIMTARRIVIGLKTYADFQVKRIDKFVFGAAPDFNETFIQATYLGRYRLAHGRREAMH